MVFLFFFNSQNRLFMTKYVNVAAAVIENGEKVLISSRPAGKGGAGFWEFPGGKLEPGESFAVALRRELYEELAIEKVLVLDTVYTKTHAYPDATVLVHFIRCRLPEGNVKITPMENQEYKWVERKQLNRELLLAADAQVAGFLAKSGN